MKSKIRCILASFAVMAITIGSALAQTPGNVPKNTAAKKNIGQIAGSWKLQRIVDDEQKKKNQKPEAQSNQGNNAMQMLEFQPDGRYKMNNATAAIDSGSYRINEQTNVLYLESDQASSLSEWNIALQNKRLVLTGRDGQADRRYQYVYEKTKEGVSTN